MLLANDTLANWQASKICDFFFFWGGGGELSIFGKYAKNSKNCINSNVWRSLGVIGIDSVSFEAFRSVSSFFIFFQFLSSGLEGPIGVVSWLRGMHRYGFLAWKR